jgi:hypothetical protein
MRKTVASLLSASILSFAAAAHAQQAPGEYLASSAQDDAGPQNTLTSNPLWDLLGGANLAYERAISRHASLMVAGLFFDGQTSNSDGSMTSITLGELTIQPHFYFGDRSLEGFYVAPYVSLVDVSGSDTSGGAATGAGVSIGATVGWSWLVGPANIKLGIGAGVASASASGVNADGTTSVASASGVGLAADLQTGFAF